MIFWYIDMINFGPGVHYRWKKLYLQ
jgi:hypothetical protein